jgi:hypothetical protein
MLSSTYTMGNKQQRYYVTRREKYTAGVGMRATNAL